MGITDNQDAKPELSAERRNPHQIYLGTHSASSPILHCLEALVGPARFEQWLRSGTTNLGDSRRPISAEENSVGPPLIISSPQACWHARLAKESPPWLADTWQPDVERALQRIDIRYCSSYAECLSLVASLSRRPDKGLGFGATGLKQISIDTTHIVAHDLLRLFLNPEGLDETGGYGYRDADAKVATQQKDTLRLKNGLSEKHYLSLMAALRQACRQLSEPGRTIQLAVYEPFLSSSATVLSSDGDTALEGRIRDGIVWLFD